MKIILSTWLTDRSLGQSLTKTGARNRLLSYYFLIEQKITKDLLTRYVLYGRCDPRKSKEEVKYYYYHPESDSLWSSNKDIEEEGDPDGCVEQISKERAIQLQRALKLKTIPHHT
jgi:hypothetical protein